MSLLIAVIGLLFAGRLILKNYNPQGVLFITGMVMMAISIPLTGTALVASSTGWVGFDIFEYISKTFSNRAGGLGLQIMFIGGFAVLMSSIGASQVMVRVAAQPLMRLNSPYLMLAFAFILGQALSLFISSATGLGLLLMATLYPVLIRLGCSKAAVASVLASTCAIEFGPGSGNSMLAAQTAGMDIAEYFVSKQLPVISALIIIVGVIHALVQRYFDSKEAINNNDETISESQDSEDHAPLYYLLLPILPLFLMLTFSKMGIGTIRVNLPTAILISTFISLICELVRLRNITTIFKKLQGFFDDMGKVFASVVTLIIAGETFAMGLKSIGAIDALLTAGSQAGFSASIIVLFMAVLTFSISALMGSGNAAFFSFAPMVPQIADKIGANVAEMMLPIQLSAGFGRTISPIAGVIIAVAGIAGLSPFDIVRRTLIPMLAGWLIMLLITFGMSGQVMEILPFLAVIIAGALILATIKKRKRMQQAIAS
ncbi:C4-dicarboxylate transporter DcuC [Parendozoicomonas haliclonae]|uniref:Putative cryptic C4-dicarboxylate transporter DcuD n=1 Tax=Parendozoicomonas haliclonae TaxID=1960125 RepID=A0A1X7ANZ3_9GAMM|nr:C4-dicarboxylate transporter DcuC [Parendozoicomonas haliclonae]SMA48805.1 putative cryptic C4-dicarboxylate transporter DcuD [Parendozoicomonas haliclonae]